MNLVEVFHENIMNTIKVMLSEQTPFSIVISSRNWTNPLPERLKTQKYFTVQIQEQTLEDSYFAAGEIVINTQFGNEDNSIIIYPQDVKGILSLDMQTPLILKPFDEEPYMRGFTKARELQSNPINNFSEEELTAPVKHSLDCFVKNNPNIFEVQ